MELELDNYYNSILMSYNKELNNLEIRVYDPDGLAITDVDYDGVMKMMIFLKEVEEKMVQYNLHN